jgi:hypothetical protein
MKQILALGFLAAFALAWAGEEPARPAQNPSPMVENTRTHPRLKEERPAGQRLALRIGSLFLPEKLPPGPAPLVLHFHGGTWIPEVAAARMPAAVIAIQLGNGSAVYGKAFADPRTFADLLNEAQTRAGRKFDRVGLTAWSAGYGAVRAILQTPEHYQRVQFVLLCDGLHAGYVSGKPGPRKSELVSEDLAVFVRFARDAVAGKKQFTLTHSEIFPGTFASTTETADHLLEQLHLERKAVLCWGPMGTQILCEVKQGRFHLLGFAGNSAPDHVDLLHALPDLLQEFQGK